MARYYAPTLGVGGILSDDARLTSVCMSVAYIGAKSDKPEYTSQEVTTSLPIQYIQTAPVSGMT